MSMNVIGDLMIHGRQFVLLRYIVYIPISIHGTILLLNTKWSWHFTMGWGMHYNMHVRIVCCNEVIHRLHNTSRGDEGYFWNQNERNECQQKEERTYYLVML